MEIPHFVFVDIKKWKNGKDKAYDKKFVGTLLLSLTEEEKVANGEFDPDVMDFIKGLKLIWYQYRNCHWQKNNNKNCILLFQALLTIRCGEQVERVAVLPQHVEEISKDKQMEIARQ